MDAPGVSILNLTYRQGPDLPHLQARLQRLALHLLPLRDPPHRHLHRRPVRRPMDIRQACEDADRRRPEGDPGGRERRLGRAAHPRSGDLSFPTFRKEGCTQCKRCTVECPFGAIDEDEQRYPQFNESRCRRCGTCMGACPVRVISFENYSVDTVGQQIKAVEIPDEFDEKPRILVLACENDAYPALDMAAMNGVQYSAYGRASSRCAAWGRSTPSGSPTRSTAATTASILMGCQKGDDYQCHFVRGSEMAHYRMSKVDDTLKRSTWRPSASPPTRSRSPTSRGRPR
jgi:quinone-modifying oxidoreductase, subunit QmoB